jgi:hypothetical protein
MLGDVVTIVVLAVVALFLLLYHYPRLSGFVLLVAAAMLAQTAAKFDAGLLAVHAKLDQFPLLLVVYIVLAVLFMLLGIRQLFANDRTHHAMTSA